ncbi:hypothetical protein GZ77_12050 [Endozoicomonas montiporae]|uniref:Uncharacterized protein n=2 Tax=Endozoicomonas montiporae TaxID=1027273 RepID=A0A081N942_9GAMM|nr:hypothetical protein [Endozoicomonas montiporae]AMO55095.1 hypothetical protein EZMO1_0877 [Endozoicomonas montiporae CL-33]KEQ14965.1 hypothetical protein GZ77_12050 [Endozoicomonas montiporae]
MAKSFYTTLFSLLLLAGLAFFWNEPARAMDDQVTVSLESFPDAITAGEQIELALTVRYNEDLEIIFDPEAQEWGAMELLSSQVAPLHWVDGLWQYIIYMDVTFLLPGQHQVPTFSVDVFKGPNHWQLYTQPGTVSVRSTFNELQVNVQSIIRLDEPEQTAVLMAKATIFWLITALAGLVFAPFVRRGKKIQQLPAATPSAADIARQAHVSGSADWDGLRQWLMVATGSDPTGKLTTDEPLLHRYQCLRFSESRSPEETVEQFVKYCNQCQEKWG